VSTYYKDYRWQKGVPKGIHLFNQDVIQHEALAYKIVDDPYRKRFSVEEYHAGVFARVVYDSLLLDFRHLKPAEQQAWQKQEQSRSANTIECLIRNQDDRVVYLERNTFHHDRCRQCEVLSPFGLLLSTHHILYEDLGDLFNGVILCDRNNRPVMFKRYASNPQGEFTDLLEEQWDLMDLSDVNNWLTHGVHNDSTRK
jgi:hypothetical protein